MGTSKNVNTRLCFCCAFVMGIFLTNGIAAESPSSKNDFFTPLSPPFQEQVANLHQRKQLFNKSNYPKLRRLLARKFAQDIKYLLDEHWNDEEFRKWLLKNPDLLEEFLLAVIIEKDDVPRALRIFKGLWERWPELLPKYPELTIAICVTWDNTEPPGSQTTGADSKTTYDKANAYNNFDFYSSEKVPANRSAKRLPREFLVYVVDNRASFPERQWILENYGQKKEKIGGCYFDIQWTWDSELHKHERTVSNMKKYGGVCTVQAEYALLVCRTMGVPAYYGWPGFPKYHGGHSWIMWLEIQGVSEDGNRVQYTRESTGRYENRKDYTCHNPCPQTGNHEDEGPMYLRFQQVAHDLRAYRHSELLMKVYPTFCDSDTLTPKSRLEFLESVAKLSPGSEKAWREIAKLGTEPYFTKKDLPKVSRLIDRMFTDMSASPNLIPALVENLLAFEDAKPERVKLYQKVAQRMKQLNRPDLVFDTINRLARFLSDEKRYEDVVNIVGQTALAFHQEESRVDPILNLIEQAASHDEKTHKTVSRFYATFVEQVFKPQAKVPDAYRRDMLVRSIGWFEKAGPADTLDNARFRLLQLDAAK